MSRVWTISSSVPSFRRRRVPLKRAQLYLGADLGLPLHAEIDDVRLGPAGVAGGRLVVGVQGDDAALGIDSNNFPFASR